MTKYLVTTVLACFLSTQALSKEILIGVERTPLRSFAVVLTPLVVTDVLAIKTALEYRLHPKFNLVIPFEGKWMDYRWLLGAVGNLIKFPRELPQYWYRPNAVIKPGWNFDYSHIQFSSGVGLKYFPFSESMQDGFFIKALAMVGIERFEAFAAEGIRDSAVISQVLTFGYTWVKGDSFTMGFEFGEEWTYHTNPIEKMPRIFAGFSPLLQFSLGFNI